MVCEHEPRERQSCAGIDVISREGIKVLLWRQRVRFYTSAHRTCIYGDSPPSIALQTNTGSADNLELLHMLEPGLRGHTAAIRTRDTKRPAN